MGGYQSAVSTRPGAGSLLLILISLYLVLISFFFVLNRYAEVEAVRERKALESVKATFSRLALPRSAPDDRTPDRGTYDGDRRYLVTAAHLLADAVPGAQARGGPQTDMLTIMVPTDALFADGRVTVRPERVAMLTSLRDLVSRAPAGSRRDLRLYLGTGTRTLIPAPDGAARIALLRAGALGRRLADLDGPRGSVGVGLTQGRDDRMAFVFLSRPEMGSRIRSPLSEGAP